MIRLRIIGVGIVLGILSIIGAMAQQKPHLQNFLLQFDTAGISSLKHLNDRHDTEYIARDQTLGHVSIRYRMLKGKWRHFSTQGIPEERTRVQISKVEDFPLHQVIYNQSGWNDYFADLEVQEGFRVEGEALL